MRTLRTIVLIQGLLSLLAWTSAPGQVRFHSPQPGDIYREYIHVMNGNGDELQVRDPNIQAPWEYLYAPPINISIGDLNGAIRAEAVIAYIGGHVSTVGQKMRWNDHDWVDIPLLDTSNGIPAGHPGYNYMMIHDITLDVPLSWLHEGLNTFQGTSGGQADANWGWGWGQWGWYAMMVRIYYGPDKPHATGVISSESSGGILGDNPTITASVSSGSVQRMDFLAYYDDYDTDGDGIYLQYHHDYMFDSSQTSDDAFRIQNHVGSATSAPWSVTWNTDWVPDQPAGQVKLLARIKDVNDVWSVTPEVKDLSLVRVGKSVRLYKPLDVPECCWVRLDVRNGTEQVHFNIPSSDKLTDATAAQYYVRLWNGGNYGWEKYPEFVDTRHFNGWSDVRFGARHAYTFDTRALPPSALQSGENTWNWYCNINYDHGIEILWPGPALAVRYTGDYASPVPGTVTLDSPQNGSGNEMTDVMLKWHPALAAASYDVEVSTDSLFGNVVDQKKAVTDTSVEIASLSGQSRYFWHVRSVNAVGASVYSETWTFGTLLQLPVQVVLVSPEDHAGVLVSDSVRFAWRLAVPAVDSYRFEIASDSLFTHLYVDSTVTDTVKYIQIPAAVDYWWKVAAHNGVGWGPFSPVWRIYTLIEGLAARQEIPREFTLSQNYPNPFNPTTVIRFGLPHREQVRLVVYNTLGEMVAELMNQSLEAGYHEVSFSAGILPSGVYFYRVAAGSFTETKKLLLLR